MRSTAGSGRAGVQWLVGGMASAWKGEGPLLAITAIYFLQFIYVFLFSVSMKEVVSK